MSPDCSSDSKEWRDLFTRTDVSAEFCVDSNSIDLDLDMDGSTGAWLDEGQTIARARVDIKREILDGVASDARDIITRGMRDQFDIPSPSMLPGGARQFGTIPVTVDSAQGGYINIGEYRSSASKSVNYNRPSVRIPPRVESFLPEEIEVDVTFSASSFLDRLRGVSPVTVTLEIPIDSFIEIEVRDVGICSMQFSEVEDAAETIQEVVRDRRSSFDTVRSTIDEVYEEFDGFSRQPDLSRFRGGESRYNTFRNRLESAVESWEKIEPEISQDLRPAVNTYRSRINSVSEECREQFRNMAEGNLDKAEEMTEDYRRINNRVKMARDLLDMPKPDGSRVDDAVDNVRENLEEISNRIRTRVDNFRAAVSEFKSTNFNRRNRERRQNLINEGEELLSDIRSLKVGRPGRAEALGEVRAALNDLRRINAPSAGQVPCGDLYQDVERALNNLEDYVEDLDRDVTEEDLNTIHNLEETVVSRIGNVDEAKCEGRFTRRLRTANRRVNVITSPIRIREEVMSESRDRRQELIQQLIDN